MTTQRKRWKRKAEDFLIHLAHRFLLHAYEHGWKPMRLWELLFWAIWNYQMERMVP